MINVDEVKEYSKDYKEFKNSTRLFFFSVQIDFEFALSLPQMEERVYYKRDSYFKVKEHLNSNGIYLIFDYRLDSKIIDRIWVKFDRYCQVKYKDEEDMRTIVEMLKEFKAKIK